MLCNRAWRLRKQWQLSLFRGKRRRKLLFRGKCNLLSVLLRRQLECPILKENWPDHWCLKWPTQLLLLSAARRELMWLWTTATQKNDCLEAAGQCLGSKSTQRHPSAGCWAIVLYRPPASNSHSQFAAKSVSLNRQWLSWAYPMFGTWMSVITAKKA